MDKSDLNECRDWMVNIGCPFHIINQFKDGKIPVEAIKILMRTVRPCSEAQDIRTNILLARVNHPSRSLRKSDDKTDRLQRFEKMKDLEAKIEAANFRLTDLREIRKQLADSISKKNIEKMELHRHRDAIKLKQDVFDAKMESLARQIEQEKASLVRIKENMPILPNATNSDENLANEAIAATFEEIDKYNNRGLAETSDKDEIWSKIRGHLGKIPNAVLWTVIMKEKDAQLNKLDELSKLASVQQPELECLSLKNEALERGKTRARITIMNAILDRVMHQKKYDRITELYIDQYAVFEKMVIQKMSKFNNHPGGEHQNSIVEEYLIVQLSNVNFSVEINFIERMIKKQKLTNTIRAEALKGHTQLINDLRRTYSEINEIATKIQTEIHQLHGVKEKINYSIEMIKFRMPDQTRRKKNTALNRTQMNLSEGSFAGYDSLLCSTKIGNTIFDLDTTARADAEMIQLPMYVKEMQMLDETPFQVLTSLPTSLFSINQNPMSPAADMRLLCTNIPIHLLTAAGAIDLINRRCALYKHSQILAKEDIERLRPVKVNIKELQEQCNAQFRIETDLFEEIAAIGETTGRVLDKCKLLLKLWLNNSLHASIPPTRLFKNRNYQDYEAEFKMYYRMIKDTNQ